jgi:hypothetical protein
MEEKNNPRGSKKLTTYFRIRDVTSIDTKPPEFDFFHDFYYYIPKGICKYLKKEGFRTNTGTFITQNEKTFLKKYPTKGVRNLYGRYWVYDRPFIQINLYNGVQYRIWGSDYNKLLDFNDLIINNMSHDSIIYINDVVDIYSFTCLQQGKI